MGGRPIRWHCSNVRNYGPFTQLMQIPDELLFSFDFSLSMQGITVAA